MIVMTMVIEEMWYMNGRCRISYKLQESQKGTPVQIWSIKQLHKQYF